MAKRDIFSEKLSEKERREIEEQLKRSRARDIKAMEEANRLRAAKRQSAIVYKKEAIQAESIIHRGQKKGDAAHDRYTWIMDQMKNLSDLAKKKLREAPSDDLLEAVDRIADAGGYLTKSQIELALKEIAKDKPDEEDEDVIF